MSLAEFDTSTSSRRRPPSGSNRPRFNLIGVLPILAVAVLLDALALLRMNGSEQPASYVPDFAEVSTAASAADTGYAAASSQSMAGTTSIQDARGDALDDWLLSAISSSASQADVSSATYELTVTGTDCSLMLVGSALANPPSNHMYASGQNMVEVIPSCVQAAWTESSRWDCRSTCTTAISDR